jgi:hypothetical protein
MRKRNLKRKSLSLAIALLLCLGLASPAFAEVTALPSVTVEIPKSDGVQFTLTNVAESCVYSKYSEQEGEEGNFYMFFVSDDSKLSSNRAIYQFDADRSGGLYTTSPEYMQEEAADRLSAPIATGSAVELSDCIDPERKDMQLGGTGYSVMFVPIEYYEPWTSEDELGEDTLLPLSDIAVADAEDPTPASLTARPTASPVLVNGESKSFDAYNINDNNYFKLRDLAYILSGTEKQFEVGWDGAANAISLTSGQPYTAVGGEMASKGSEDRQAAPTSSKIAIDGAEVSLTAYNIEGNNYFKLRDIGAALDFGVTWDAANKTIVISTSEGYTPE